MRTVTVLFFIYFFRYLFGGNEIGFQSEYINTLTYDNWLYIQDDFDTHKTWRTNVLLENSGLMIFFGGWTGVPEDDIYESE